MRVKQRAGQLALSETKIVTNLRKHTRMCRGVSAKLHYTDTGVAANYYPPPLTEVTPGVKTS